MPTAYVHLVISLTFFLVNFYSLVNTLVVPKVLTVPSFDNKVPCIFYRSEHGAVIMILDYQWYFCMLQLFLHSPPVQSPAAKLSYIYKLNCK